MAKPLMVSEQKKREQLMERLTKAIIAGSLGVTFFIFLVYAMNGRTMITVPSPPPASPEPPMPPSPPPMQPAIPPAPPNGHVVRNITQELEQKLLLANMHQFEFKKVAEDKLQGKNVRFKGKGQGKDEMLLSKDQWRAVKEMQRAAEAEKKHEKGANHLPVALKKSGNWYWGESAVQKGVSEGVLRQGKAMKATGTGYTNEKELCFWNATRRAADYWEPVHGNWAFHKKVLPIYAYFDCWADNVRIDVLMPQYNCHSHHQAQQCQRMHFEGNDCALIPLDPSRLLHLLQDRTIWFFGDYTSRQQYLALKCTMWQFQVQRIDLTQNTAKTSEAWLFQNGIRLIYVHAGLHQSVTKKHRQAGPEDSVKKAMGRDPAPKSGLTAEFMATHGLTHTAGMDLETKQWGGLSVGMLPLDEQLMVFMPDMKPWDLIIANIGQEFSEARVYQRHMLNFLKVYDNKKDIMPVLFWRETSAQHHDPLFYRGGDISAPIHREYLAPPPPMKVPKVGRGRAAVMPHPMAHVECKAVPFQVHKENNWRNELANRLVETAGIPVVRIWEASTKRHDWYSNQCNGPYCERFGPCQHYCNPGVTTHWNEVVRTMLEAPTIKRAFDARLPAPPPPPEAPEHPPLPPGVILAPDIPPSANTELWDSATGQELSRPPPIEIPPPPPLLLAAGMEGGVLSQPSPPPPPSEEYKRYNYTQYYQPPLEPPPPMVPPGMLLGGEALNAPPPELRRRGDAAEPGVETPYGPSGELPPPPPPTPPLINDLEAFERKVAKDARRPPAAPSPPLYANETLWPGMDNRSNENYSNEYSKETEAPNLDIEFGDMGSVDPMNHNGLRKPKPRAPATTRDPRNQVIGEVEMSDPAELEETHEDETAAAQEAAWQAGPGDGTKGGTAVEEQSAEALEARITKVVVEGSLPDLPEHRTAVPVNEQWKDDATAPALAFRSDVSKNMAAYDTAEGVLNKASDPFGAKQRAHDAEAAANRTLGYPPQPSSPEEAAAPEPSPLEKGLAEVKEPVTYSMVDNGQIVTGHTVEGERFKVSELPNNTGSEELAKAPPAPKTDGALISAIKNIQAPPHPSFAQVALKIDNMLSRDEEQAVADDRTSAQIDEDMLRKENANIADKIIDTFLQPPMSPQEGDATNEEIVQSIRGFPPPSDTSAMLHRQELDLQISTPEQAKENAAADLERLGGTPGPQ